MEFTRRVVPGGRFQEWISDCGHYRVTYYGEFGANHYYANVLSIGPGGAECWLHAHRHGKYRTFKAATTACEKNQRIWGRFIKLSHSSGRRDAKLQALMGKPKDKHVFNRLPVWVLPEAEPGLIKMAFPKCQDYQNPNDPTKT